MLMRVLRLKMWKSNFTICCAFRPGLGVSRCFGNMSSSSRLAGKSVHTNEMGGGFRRVFPSIVGQVNADRLYHKLHVGNLPKEATVDVLQEHFSKYGMVLNAEIVRNRETLESRGHGFVIFADKQALDDAVASESHIIKNQAVSVHSVKEIQFIVKGLSPVTTEESLRIYFSRYGVLLSCIVKHYPSEEIHQAFVSFAGEINIGQALTSIVHVIDGKQVEVDRIVPREFLLRVNNLSPLTTDESLAAHFSRFGNLLRAKVIKDRWTGESREFGFVCFSTQKEFNSAICSPPHIIDGREVILEYGTGKFTLFVAELPPNTTEKTLKQYFEKFGRVFSCRIARDKRASHRINFGWVVFCSHQGLDGALAARPLVIDGKEIGAQPSQRQTSKSCTLFVGGLTPRTTEAMLYGAFCSYGSLLRCQLKYNSGTKRSRGYGFIAYSTLDEVSRALLACPHVVDDKVVDVELLKSASKSSSLPSSTEHRRK